MNKKLFKKRNFLYRTFSFSGYITAGNFWSEIGIRLIEFFCASIFLCIAVSVLVPGDTEDLIDLVHILVPALGLLWAVPIVPLTRRRLRDAGYSAKSYLWLLLPVIGWIVFIVRMFAKSVPRKPGELWFE